MRGLNYPPHFTFVIYDEINPSVLRDVTGQVFQGKRKVQIMFDRISYFDAEQFVLWAAPQKSSVLYAFHEEIHSLIKPALCRDYYRAGVWIPHCTLSFGIASESKEDVRQMVGEIASPFEVEFETADCVEFLPVRVLEERVLL